MIGYRAVNAKETRQAKGPAEDGAFSTLIARIVVGLGAHPEVWRSAVPPTRGWGQDAAKYPNIVAVALDNKTVRIPCRSWRKIKSMSREPCSRERTGVMTSVPSSNQQAKIHAAPCQGRL